MHLRKNIPAKMILMAILFVAVLCGSVWKCNESIVSTIEDSIRSSLRDVAEQNRFTLENIVDSRYSLLMGVCRQIQATPEQVETILGHMDAYSDSYLFKRMGYITPDGMSITTDGYTQDLSFREYFQKGMKGHPDITGVLTEIMGEPERINVFSVPVTDKLTQEVMGVLYVSYATSTMQQILDVESFGGRGYGYIIEKDGTVITASKKSPLTSLDNLFDAITRFNPDSVAEAEAFRSQIAQGGTGEMIVNSDEEKYCYYQPLTTFDEDEPWFMVTVVPSQVMHERQAPILLSMQVMTLLVMTLCAIFSVLSLHNQRMRRRELTALAYRDELTGGENYASFLKKMEGRHGGFVVSMDLDSFKIINSMFGAKKGDEVLRSIYGVIERWRSRNELAAHISADHFVFWLDEEREDSVSERIHVLEQQIRQLSEELGVMHILPKFGVYGMRHNDDAQKGYEYANLAKNTVKGKRDRCLAFHRAVNQHELYETAMIEDTFESALSKRRFEIWFQPKYRPQDDAIVGAEALVRWRMADGTQILPSRFIPLFEKNGTIAKLDEYMFTSVCEQQCRWRKEGLALLPISINLSRATLCNPSTAQRYKSIINACNLDPRLVPLEITESAMIDNEELLSLLKQFHQYGFRILIDDFGQGQSSLSVLKIPYIDTIKLDKSLIDCIGDNKGEILLRQIIRMALDLGLRITAEGVEKEDQVHFLKDLKCSDIQGYFYHRPMPLTDFENLISMEN